MSDLKLVAPVQPTALERLLMSAATNDAPSAEQRMRVRQALGLPHIVVAEAPVLHVGRAAALGKAAVGSMLMASAVIALWVSGAAHKFDGLPERVASPAPMRATIVPLQAQLPPEAEPAAAPFSPAESTSVQPQARGVRAPKPATTTMGGSGAPKRSSLSGNTLELGDQMQLIEAARAAVAGGDASAALHDVSSYSTKFPHGSFGQEAAVLRIEALGLQGNQRQAATLARSFLAQHPNSPHVNVVQGIADRSQ